MRIAGGLAVVALAPSLAGCAPAIDRWMVIDAGDGRAMLCVEGVMESYPPQCDGDIPVIEDWDWSAVEHEEESGVRWGEYRVVGERQGDAFVLSEPPQRMAPGQP